MIPKLDAKGRADRSDHFSKRQWKKLPFPYLVEGIGYVRSDDRLGVGSLEYKDKFLIPSQHMSAVQRENLEKQ